MDLNLEAAFDEPVDLSHQFDFPAADLRLVQRDRRILHRIGIGKHGRHGEKEGELHDRAAT